MTSIETVFNTLHAHRDKPLTRAQIVAITKLNKDTVGTALARLTQMGYLKAGGRKLKRTYQLFSTATVYTTQRLADTRTRARQWVPLYGKDQPFLLGECWKRRLDEDSQAACEKTELSVSNAATVPGNG